MLCLRPSCPQGLLVCALCKDHCHEGHHTVSFKSMLHNLTAPSLSHSPDAVLASLEEKFLAFNNFLEDQLRNIAELVAEMLMAAQKEYQLVREDVLRRAKLHSDITLELTNIAQHYGDTAFDLKGKLSSILHHCHLDAQIRLKPLDESVNQFINKYSTLSSSLTKCTSNCVLALYDVKGKQ
jgi:hypothetical protein